MADFTYVSDFFSANRNIDPAELFGQLQQPLISYLLREKKIRSAQIPMILSDIYWQWEEELLSGNRKSLKNMKRTAFVIADRCAEELQHEIDKNFGLTEEEFDVLLRALQNGDQRLYEQTFLNHFQPCMQYLQRAYGASHSDAYDATMDTLLVFCKRLRAGKITYGNLRFLFTRIAGQVYFRSKKKQGPLLDTEELPEITEVIDTVDPDALNILNKAWQELCDGCRALLKAFYYENINLNEYASAQGRTHAAVRKQKQRCVKKLSLLFTQKQL